MNSKKFFTELPFLFKVLGIFIRGDLFFLLPLVVLIALSYVWSVVIGMQLTGAYLIIRYMGEMMYWINQQFSDRTYRPNDFGLKNLDNNAIYILYQTIAIAHIMTGAALVAYSLSL